jgi:cytochrome c
MKTIALSIVAITGLVAGGIATAVEMPAVGKRECAACHAVDHNVVGPAFEKVSKKYSGQKDEVAEIEASIKKGGSFGWHLGAMPPRGMGASDADAETMAKFIAGLSSQKQAAK